MRQNKNRSLMKKLQDALRRLLRKQPPQPEDPYAYVMAPAGRKAAAGPPSPKSKTIPTRASRHAKATLRLV